MPTAMEFRFVLDDQTARTQGSQGVTAPGTSSPDVPQGGDPFAGSRTRYDAVPAFANGPNPLSGGPAVPAGYQHPESSQAHAVGAQLMAAQAEAQTLARSAAALAAQSVGTPGGIPAFPISPGPAIPPPAPLPPTGDPYLPPGGWAPPPTPLGPKGPMGEELKEVPREVYEKHQQAEETRRQQERVRPVQDAAGMAARAGVPGAGAAGQAMGAFASGNPAGGAFAAIDAAKEVVGKFAQVIDEASERVRKFGKFQEDIVRNDYIAAGKKLYDAGGDQLSGMTGLGGPAVKAALNNGLARFEAWQGVNNAIVERGKELSPYSGELASATAMANVRSLMADIKEAQDMGASMAKVVEAQSKTDAYIRETIGPWKAAWMESKAKEASGQSKIVEGFGVAAKDKESTIGQMNDVLLLLYRISKGLDPIVPGKKDDAPPLWESFFADDWLGDGAEVPIAGDGAGRPFAAGDF